MTSILTGRVPMFVFSIALAMGVRAISGERAVLVVGTNAAAVVAYIDDTVYDVTSEADAIAIYGRGFPAHRVIKNMYAAEPNVKIRAVIAGDNAATAATKSCALAVLPTVAGVLKLQVADEILEISVTAGEAINDIGAAIVAEYALHPDCPAVITFATPNVIITAKGLGVEGNLLKYRWYDIPTTLTISNSSGVLAGGTGTPGWSTAYAAAFGGGAAIDFVVPTTNTTATLITATTGLRDRIQTMALPANGKPMNAILGWCGTGADARTAADSYDLGTNAYTEVGWRFQIIDAPSSYNEEWCVAGAVAAVRSVATDGESRNYNWPGIWPDSIQIAGLIVTGIALSDYPDKADWNTDLSNGVSPLSYDYTTGVVRLVGSCTCKHVSGGAPDFRAAWSNHIDVMDALAVYCTAKVATAYAHKNIADDVNGRPPEKLGENSVTPSMVKTILEGGYVDCVGFEWVDETYVDGAGVTKSVYPLFEVARDASTPEFCNAKVPAFVRDWFLGAGIQYEEYGTG
jgi:phage tail sheath gpL-like